ncbi:hypothetical protein GDO81_010293 [Engystomops pustulosus]|uniref:Uncharacterized protein n=1 Tax=Engystomops pustulosus TaxID=76066 RepID=A0AAV7BYM7_ENGPU|nr:hypothetical protein GDO81_010293 [Engystomops pustulosus]
MGFQLVPFTHNYSWKCWHFLLCLWFQLFVFMLELMHFKLNYFFKTFFLFIKMIVSCAFYALVSKALSCRYRVTKNRRRHNRYFSIDVIAFYIVQGRKVKYCAYSLW